MQRQAMPADQVLAELKTLLEIRELASPGAEFARKKTKKASTFNEQIAAIDKELKTVHHFHFSLNARDKKEALAKKENAIRHAKHSQADTVRIIYLIHERDYLIEINRLIDKLEAYADVDRTVGMFEHRHPMMVALHIWKKIADVLDDIWNIIKGALPQRLFNSVGPFLTAVTGFFIHCMEGYDGLSDTFAAYFTNKMPQRKTRLLTAALTTGLATIGVILSVTLFMGTFGAPIEGLAILQVLIPSLLTCIYSLALVRNAYIYDQTKFKAERAAIKLKATFKELSFANDCTNIESLFALLKKGEKANRRAEHYNQSYPLAERRVAFNVVEVTSSMIVSIGNALTIPALWAPATFASFGALPLGLLITGVCAGFAGKFADWYDEKHDCYYYKKTKEKMTTATQWWSNQNLTPSKTNFLSSAAQAIRTMTSRNTAKPPVAQTPGQSRPARKHPPVQAATYRGLPRGVRVSTMHGRHIAPANTRVPRPINLQDPYDHPPKRNEKS